MYDLQAMFMASQVALQKNNSCQSIPFMKIQPLQLIVNNSGFTIPINDSMSMSYPISYVSIDWIQGNQNGTYDMATEIVKYIDS